MNQREKIELECDEEGNDMIQYQMKRFFMIYVKKECPIDLITDTIPNSEQMITVFDHHFLMFRWQTAKVGLRFVYPIHAVRSKSKEKDNN